MRLSNLSGAAQARDPEIVGLTADSREVRPGFLFAALAGETFDGAEFIPAAEKAGAAAVLARPGVASSLPLIADPEPRRRLAQMTARFYPRQPEIVAGVTGTNGKTSVARFTAQIWRRLGKNAGSLGTLGASAPGFERKLVHTTPEPVTLHETLDEMAAAGVTHLAMEVSSHGLAQHRADGVRFRASAYTNITQDHLDYHADFEDYMKAKLRLFTELLPADGVAVVNADGEGAEDVIEAARARKLDVMTVGAAGRDICLAGATPHPGGLEIRLETGAGAEHVMTLPLIGAFQAENALVAAGLAIASGEAPDAVLPLLESLQSVPGRMERAAEAGGGAVYVDYAHTPDAIATALQAIRPHVSGKLIVIVGAGGDRDKTKRAAMGAAATTADAVIVTDDNPRSEDPAEIRRQVLAGCPDAFEIGDRREAIARGIGMLSPGDVLLVAGKGHETGQIVGGVTSPFDDAEIARAEAAKRKEDNGR
ncbi:MAG: UDP-N-acetylmuramoyl-L-alanyl-D-glutamate--2,6-diaminopimelate ligase [Parvularculaceae bacterium]